MNLYKNVFTIQLCKKLIPNLNKLGIQKGLDKELF